MSGSCRFGFHGLCAGSGFKASKLGTCPLHLHAEAWRECPNNPKPKTRDRAVKRGTPPSWAGGNGGIRRCAREEAAGLREASGLFGFRVSACSEPSSDLLEALKQIYYEKPQNFES